MRPPRAFVLCACAASTVLLALAAAVLPAAIAEAHNYPVSTVPATGATLETLPDRFLVTTNDNLLDLGGESKGFAIEIVDAAGKFFGNGCVTVSGPRLSTAAAAGPGGSYSILWQGVSVDGHLVSGKIPFTWNPTTDGQTQITAGSKTPPVCGAENPTAAPADTATLPILPGDRSTPSAVGSTPPTPSEVAAAAKTSTSVDAARAEDPANTLFTLASVFATLLVLITAVILARRRKTRSPGVGDDKRI